jgi:hypothetical protein
VSEPLSPEFILRLQRQIGNRAVTHFLRRRAAEADPARLVVPADMALVEAKAELAVTLPTEPASTAVVETKVEVAVTVPAEIPLPLPAWRRMVNWIARTVSED